MVSTSMKPYFVRALYDWCVDEGHTPHIVVRVDEHCRVPRQFVRDGEITLNVGPLATKDFFMDKEWVSFTARFSGVSQMVSFPITAIAAVYSRDTQEGMGFEVTAYQGGEFVEPEVASEETPNTKSGKKPTIFKLVD